jgi:hypothetical protein
MSIEPKQSLFEENPSSAQLGGAERQAAIASSRMHFEVPDAAPQSRLDRILWHNARGWSVPYPQNRLSVFARMLVSRDE